MSETKKIEGVAGEDLEEGDAVVLRDGKFYRGRKPPHEMKSYETNNGLGLGSRCTRCGRTLEVKHIGAAGGGVVLDEGDGSCEADL